MGIKDDFIYYEFAKQDNNDFHSHRNIEIIYLIKGQIFVTVENQKFDLKMDDIILINTMNKHKIQCDNNCIFVKLYLNYAKLSEITKNKNKYFLCNSTIHYNDNYKILRQYIIKILNEHFENKDYKELYMNKLNSELLIFLINNFCDNIITDYSVETNERDRINKILDYIDGHFKDNLRLEDLANQFYVTPQYLSKYFKENTGITFLKYINNIRLQYAIEDLKNTNDTILKIALDNGFPNVSSFTKVFYDSYKTKPTEYRKKYKINKKEELSNDFYKEIEEYINDNYVDEKNDFNKVLDVDASIKEKYNPYWKEMIDLGEIDDYFNTDIQNQIIMIKKDLGFNYAKIRFSCFPQDLNKKYDFYKIERKFDFLIDNGFKIFISIDYRMIKENDIFYKYLENMISHFANRYSIVNIRQWKFELYYNSDYEYDKGIKYFDVFKKIQIILDKYNINNKLIGPGLLINYDGDNLKRYLIAMKKSNINSNTLSLSVYPYTYGKIEDVLMMNRITDSNYIKNQCYLAKKISAEMNIKFNEIYITDWNDSLSKSNVINDSCYKGAYIVKNIIDCFDEMSSLCYSNPLDLFLSRNLTNDLLSGLSGLINKQGIKKPSFYSYLFFNKVGKYLVYRDEHNFITSTETRNFTIISHNCKKLNYKYYTRDENDINANECEDLFDDNQNLRAKYNFNNIENGKYQIKIRTINNEFGSLQDECLRMNISDDSNIGLGEVEYLKNISSPQIRLQSIIVENNKLSFECELKPNEIKYIHIIYQY